jgi:uncharacterized protein YbjQ (UPF0145 family)
MAQCKKCNKKIGFLDYAASGICLTCYKIEHMPQSDEDVELHKHRVEQDAKVNAIMLTTETAPKLNITKRIEIVTAECAFGMNLFKDLFAGVRDIVGGRSKAVQQTMRDSRRTALYELKREAYEVGANAVVGVDLDYVELSGAGNMVMLVASGTAVVIDGQ